MDGSTSEILALASAVAWASGINLYAAVLALGAMHYLGIVTLPESMQVVASFPVLAAAAGLYIAQFVADKIPGVDLGWDAIHTFIRIPAGAFLAAATVGDADSALKVAAALAGGALSLGTHATKASGRLFVNAHLPFVGTALASVAEDIAVIGGLYAAVTNPVWFLGAIAIGIVVMGLTLWLLAKFLRFAFAKLASLFRGTPA